MEGVWESIKSFFQNKTVQIVAWVMLIISSAVLILAGIAGADINNVILLVVGVIEAVGTLIAAIGKLLLKKATTNK